MKTLRSFLRIVNYQTFLIMGLALLSTYLCREHKYTTDFPLTLVGIAIVFPLVFSINSAYKRRETALNHYGTLKGNARAIFFAAVDWIENPAVGKIDSLKSVQNELFTALNLYFHSTGENQLKEEQHVYATFRKMSAAIKDFRAQGMSGSEVSRSNQYLSKMFISFEQLKHIYQYRTPVTLRAYSKIFISILPIVYGPYFAKVTDHQTFLYAAILPVIFSLILVSLDNIQEHLENPFDRIGEDDIYINSDKFIKGLESGF